MRVLLASPASVPASSCKPPQAIPTLPAGPAAPKGSGGVQSPRVQLTDSGRPPYFPAADKKKHPFLDHLDHKKKEEPRPRPPKRSPPPPPPPPPGKI